LALVAFVMPLLLFALMLLAACGFTLSLVAHIMSLLGRVIPGGGLVFWLHVGIFAVWIPTGIITNRIARRSNQKDWKVILAGCPRWMRLAFYLLFGYAVCNFVLFMITTIGHPQPKGATPPSVIRGFSGHWMLFYGAAFATLYSVIFRPNQVSCSVSAPETTHKKRDEWIVRLGLLGIAIFFGYSFIGGQLRGNWIEYWLAKDAKQTMAMLTEEFSHGVVEYTYSIGPTTYTGRSQRNWEQPKYRDVGIGQNSIVFYSASHPWLSSLETPQFPRSGSIILLVAIPIEFFLIVTVINPRSRWALNVLQDQQKRS
jgi:hypothetical protein